MAFPKHPVPWQLKLSMGLTIFGLIFLFGGTVAYADNDLEKAYLAIAILMIAYGLTSTVSGIHQRLVQLESNLEVNRQALLNKDNKKA